MPWAKFSDDTQRNEHILGLTVPARWLWASAIMDNRSYEGGRSPFISAVRANALVRQQGISRKLIAELVEAGRWEPTEGGWNIHNFAKYLPTRREESADHEPDPIKSSAGSKGAASRWQSDSKPDSTPVASPWQNGSPVARGPVPVPVPVPVVNKQERLDQENESSPSGDFTLSTTVSKDLVGQIFEAWRQMWHSNARLTRKRRAFIQARLHEGWTVEDLVLAVTVGAANDPWDKRHLSFNDDLKYLLKDGESVEKFLGFVNQPPGIQTAATRQGNRLRELAHAMREAE